MGPSRQLPGMSKTRKEKVCPMPQLNVFDEIKARELVAELAEATYRVARRNEYRGALIDIELDLWQLHGSLPQPGEKSPEER